MQLSIKSGKYVLAVSGGVDSMVLLHLLAKLPDIQLVVAHFEHGIRPDSDTDRQVVAARAAELRLPFIYEHGNLGAGASEATARAARYVFLERVRAGHDAAGIITAHHQDDLLETAVINLLRGTGRKGLTALADNAAVIRPLLETPKADLIQYAKAHDIHWREDSTNASQAYYRNYVRHSIMPRFSPGQRQELLAIIAVMRHSNAAIDTLITDLIAAHESTACEVDRQWLAVLPDEVAREYLAGWLRRHGLRDFNKRTIARLLAAVRGAEPGKYIDAQAGLRLQISRHTVRLLLPS